MRATLGLFVLMLQQCAQLAAASKISECFACATQRVSSTPAHRACLLELRGGADDDLLDAEDEETDDADTAAVEDTLENPFIGAPGAGGGGADGVGLQDLASTLQNPAALQDALKELQDPAVQAQVKAMLEDPAFQESMKQYMEQITKDPQFEELKKQTEAMLQEEGFVEQMTKALTEMGPGMAQAAAALGAGGDAEDDAEEK